MYAIEYHDFSRIKKLENLSNLETFWDDVRRMTKNITSDHSIKRWQILAEQRERELKERQIKE